jgi:hypothetical protein
MQDFKTFFYSSTYYLDPDPVCPISFRCTTLPVTPDSSNAMLSSGSAQGEGGNVGASRGCVT